jgi:uncharacterized protein (TIGR00661 family)
VVLGSDTVRARDVILYLRSQNHRVLVLTYGQGYESLKDLAHVATVVKIDGIPLIFEEGTLSKRKTLHGSFHSVFNNLKNFRHLKTVIERFSPDVCISDMEPVASLVSRLKRLPLISFDNQHQLTHLAPVIPSVRQRDFLVARSVVRRYVGEADAFIILSFFKKRCADRRVFVTDPLLRKEVIRARPRTKNFILVYQTRPDERLFNVLRSINESFIVYGHHASKHDGNLRFKPVGASFLSDLVSCKAVIASAGFSLMSEALYLKKPYFAIPLEGQFEQYYNALCLRKARFGTFSVTSRARDITQFLSRLDIYRRNLARYAMCPTEALDTLQHVLERFESSH